MTAKMCDLCILCLIFEVSFSDFSNYYYLNLSLVMFRSIYFRLPKSVAVSKFSNGLLKCSTSESKSHGRITRKYYLSFSLL